MSTRAPEILGWAAPFFDILPAEGIFLPHDSVSVTLAFLVNSMYQNYDA